MRSYHAGGGRGRKFRLGYKHTIVVPPSTKNCLIFPVDRVKGNFNMNFYDTAMTQGRVSSEEIASFLQELDPVVKPIFNSRMNSFLKFYQRKLHPCFMLGLVVLFALGVFFMTRGALKLFFVLPGVFAAIFLSTVIIMIINCLHVANVKSLIKESKDKIMPIVLSKNTDFKRKGYFWVAPHNFPYWIELWTEEASNMRVQYGLQGMSLPQQYGINVQEIPYGNASSTVDYSSP